MNMLSNNLKILMEKNLRVAQRKDLNLNKLKKKRNHSKNLNQVMKDFANLLKKS